MKIMEAVDLCKAGAFPSSSTWNRAETAVEEAIRNADWPHGSGRFSLNPEPKAKPGGGDDRHPNGVDPIKIPMINHLRLCDWEAEALPELPVGAEGGDVLTTGDLDALFLNDGHYVGFEWETGNVSSSHRAINKLLDGITRGTLQGGILVVGMREMARYLTERVGNFEELSPYFEFWKRYPVPEGILRIYGVTFDELNPEVPYIPKRTDGRARR